MHPQRKKSLIDMRLDVFRLGKYDQNIIEQKHDKHHEWKTFIFIQFPKVHTDFLVSMIVVS